MKRTLLGSQKARHGSYSCPWLACDSSKVICTTISTQDLGLLTGFGFNTKNIFGASLLVQWLRHCASNAGSMGSILCGKTKILHCVWPKKIKTFLSPDSLPSISTFLIPLWQHQLLWTDLCSFFLSSDSYIHPLTNFLINYNVQSDILTNIRAELSFRDLVFKELWACFPQSFIVSSFIFRSLIHFEFTFVYGVK